RHDGRLDLVADGDAQLALRVGQLGALDPRFALAPDVDEDVLGVDVDDAALHDLADFQRAPSRFAREQRGEIFAIAHVSARARRPCACDPPPVGYIPNCIASPERWTRSRTRDKVPAMLAGNPPDAPPTPATVAGRDRVSLVTYVALLLITAAAWIHILGSGMQTDDMAGDGRAVCADLRVGDDFAVA